MKIYLQLYNLCEVVITDLRDINVKRIVIHYMSIITAHNGITHDLNDGKTLRFPNKIGCQCI